MIMYVTTMYRNGDREKHSYVLGVFSNIEKATATGELEKSLRGDKYEPEIDCFIVDHPELVPGEMVE